MPGLLSVSYSQQPKKAEHPSPGPQDLGGGKIWRQNIATRMLIAAFTSLYGVHIKNRCTMPDRTDDGSKFGQHTT